MISINGNEIKICIINIYLGKLPEYFPLWLKSASLNEGIDFIVFSDDSYEDLPSNVRIINTSLSYIKRRAEEELGFEVVLDSPYKCCDYKTLYGLIFKHYLEEYDYWGHCDLDLIWGNLEHFFVENELTKYDRFLYLGHLSLYRNNDNVNNYFRLEGSRESYQEVYTTSRICVFDEVPGTVQIYLKNRIPFFYEKIFADISPAYKQFKLSLNSIDDEKILNYKQQIFYWDKGEVFRAYYINGECHTDSYAYIHFQKRPNFKIDFDYLKTDSFLITDEGFIPFDGEISKNVIIENCHYQGILKEHIEYLIMIIKRKIKYAKEIIKYGRKV